MKNGAGSRAGAGAAERCGRAAAAFPGECGGSGARGDARTARPHRACAVLQAEELRQTLEEMRTLYERNQADV